MHGSTIRDNHTFAGLCIAHVTGKPPTRVPLWDHVTAAFDCLFSEHGQSHAAEPGLSTSLRSRRNKPAERSNQLSAREQEPPNRANAFEPQGRAADLLGCLFRHLRSLRGIRNLCALLRDLPETKLFIELVSRPCLALPGNVAAARCCLRGTILLSFNIHSASSVR